MDFKPLSDWVYIRKCKNENILKDNGEILLHLPDEVKENTNWVEILAIGPKCKVLRPEHIGKLVHCSEDLSHDLMRLYNSEWIEERFVAREHLVSEYIYSDS